MSQVADAIAAERPDWGPLPDELLQALNWMQQQGHEFEKNGTYYATPYAGMRQLGVVFASGMTLQGWFDGAAAAQLLPIAESDGAGGMVALWRAPDLEADGGPAVVVLNDLEQTKIADSALDLLRLLAIGHDEIRDFTVSEEPPTETAEAHQAFREWVQTTFDVEVPTVWHDLDDESFAEWSEAQLGA